MVDEQNETEPASGPPELPPEGKKSGSRKIILVLLIVLLAGGGVAAFLFWPKSAPVEAAAPESSIEQIGPRSILEGASTLEGIYKSANGDFSEDVGALLEEYEKSPRGISELLAESIGEEMRQSNLYARIIQGGFEIAYRKEEDRWLVLSWSKGSGQKVSSVPSEGGPPFPLRGNVETLESVKGAHELVEFKGPKEYFSLMLPAGFTTNDASHGDTTQIAFIYGTGVRMTIKAMKMNRAWEPEAELALKAEQIRSGVVGAFENFDLVVTNMIEVGGATGYELGLTGRGERAAVSTHSFALGGEGVSISIALICNAPKDLSLYDALISSIRDTFTAGVGPEKKQQLAQRLLQAVAEKAAQQDKAKKKEINEADKAAWTESRAMIKTSGIMQRGGAYVALINDDLMHVDEIVSVELKGKTYRFMITSITTDNVAMEPIYEEEEEKETKSSVLFR